jgi:hypothetical protein
MDSILQQIVIAQLQVSQYTDLTVQLQYGIDNQQSTIVDCILKKYPPKLSTVLESALLQMAAVNFDLLNRYIEYKKPKSMEELLRISGFGSCTGMLTLIYPIDSTSILACNSR